MHSKGHEHDYRNASLLLCLLKVTIVLAAGLEDTGLGRLFRGNDSDMLHGEVRRRPLAALVRLADPAVEKVNVAVG